MTRFIGVRHRVKQTAKREARPTQVCVKKPGEKIRLITLKTEQDELDWVHGIFPISYRDAEGDEADEHPKHHIKLRAGVARIPDAYDGLQEGDVIAMTLGGSGDYFAYAIARIAEKKGAKFYRLPPFTLKELRGEEGKDDDSVLLAHRIRDTPELFTPVEPRDRDIIMVRQCQNALVDAMKARIACEQRLHQFVIGQSFCTDESGYIEGSIQKAFEHEKANDVILQALIKEEKVREKALTKALWKVDVFNDIFLPIEGVGPRIAGRIISSIQNIDRFETKAKLKAFAGHHVTPEGKFVRKRSGQIANWHNDLRQALFLVGDQFNRRPNSFWGKKLLENKKKLRERHPEPVEMENDKGKMVKRYTDGHIHKMALWRTQTKFLEALFRDWKRLSKGKKPLLSSIEEKAA